MRNQTISMNIAKYWLMVVTLILSCHLLT